MAGNPPDAAADDDGDCDCDGSRGENGDNSDDGCGSCSETERSGHLWPVRVRGIFANPAALEKKRRGWGEDSGESERERHRI